MHNMAYQFAYREALSWLLWTRWGRRVWRYHSYSRIHLPTSNPDEKFSFHAGFWGHGSFQWVLSISPSHQPTDSLSVIWVFSNIGHHRRQIPLRGITKSTHLQKMPPYIRLLYPSRVMRGFSLRSTHSLSPFVIDYPFWPEKNWYY